MGKFGGMMNWDADVDLHIHPDDFGRLESEVKPRVDADGYFLRKHVNNDDREHVTNASFVVQANDHNYLLIELTNRQEPWDKDEVWKIPIEGRLFPALEDPHVNLSAWYGSSYFEHRLGHHALEPMEEALHPMGCGTPNHHNCVDSFPSGKNCQHSGRC